MCITSHFRATYRLLGPRRITELTDAPVSFGLIEHDHWYQPDSIDEEKATASRKEMEKNKVIYGGERFMYGSVTFSSEGPRCFCAV